MNLKFLLNFLILFTASRTQELQSSCVIPESINDSRQTRLHHRCETNKNQYFAIETRGDFYCIFYSVLEISLFGAETNFEIKLKGNFDYEQVGRRGCSNQAN